MSKKALGKGIDALLQGKELEKVIGGQELIRVPIDKIKPSSSQPRKEFHPAALQELADSIKQKGIIQPLIAEDLGNGEFEIIAGERRFRAALIAGLEEIPICPGDFSEEEKLEIGLIENIQREDLNPIEEAQALKALMAKGSLSQEDVSRRLGKSRSAVANSLRLLKLPDDIQTALMKKEITAGHARALLSLVNRSDQIDLYRRIVRNKLSVRESEQAAQQKAKEESRVAISGLDVYQPKKLSPELAAIVQELIDTFGTKVTIRGGDNHGKIEITYYSIEDLERIIKIIKK